MGYRKLSKCYLSHVYNITGSDLVENAAIRQSLTSRELGELHSIATELKRATFDKANNTWSSDETETSRPGSPNP
jgi:hypothetical protein